MRNRPVIVGIESHDPEKLKCNKVLVFDEGITYKEMALDICTSFDLKCDPSKLRMRFMAMIMLESSEYISLSNDSEVKAFFMYFDDKNIGPRLRVSIVDDNGAFVEEILEPFHIPGSNNLAEKNDLFVAYEAEEYVCQPPLNDLPVNELEECVCQPSINTVDGDDVDQLGLLQLQNFQQHLMTLERGNDGDGTCEVANGPDDDVVVTFTDGSDISIGRVFESKTDATNAISLIAIQGNFQFCTKKSNELLLLLVCEIDGCTWRVRISKVFGSKRFVVTKYVGEHSCGMKSAWKSHRNASYDVISNLVKSRFIVGKGSSPKEIQSFMLQEHGVNISYWRAWKARQAALEEKLGSPTLGYVVLPSYFNVLKANNPGTVTDYELDDDKFLYCFVAFGASLHGFQFLKKVIAIDETFLTGKYSGVLFCASAEDGNGHIFPLAFGVVDSENDKSWNWFMERLKDVIPDNDELCFISDRNSSIIKSVSKVYASAHHGCCTYHLWQNVKTKYKCYELRGIFDMACKAYTVEEFESHMEIIKTEAGGEVWKYLVNDVGIERWSRANFPGNRYNLMTSNIAESLNSQLIVEKSWPIFSLLVALQTKLSRWFSKRREAGSNNVGHFLTPKATQTLRARFKESQCLVAERLNEFEFEIRTLSVVHVVNLERKHCSCLVFDKDRLPCAHAIAALKSKPGENMSEQIDMLCHAYYSNENWCNAYKMTIYPTPAIDQWMNGEELSKVKVLPPAVKLNRGRKRVSRYPSVGEFTKRRNQKKKCTICKKEGHYRTKCPDKEQSAVM